MQERKVPLQQSSPEPDSIEKNIFARTLKEGNVEMDAARILLDGLLDQFELSPIDKMAALLLAASRAFHSEVFFSGMSKEEASNIINQFNFTSRAAMTAAVQLAFHKRERRDETKRAPLHCPSGTAQSHNTTGAPRPTAERVEPNFNG